MGFSIFVEVLNLRMRAKEPREPVELHQRYASEDGEANAP
jgi:hypothetical protein